MKTWMDESLGATYSDRTYTKKIQAPPNRDFRGGGFKHVLFSSLFGEDSHFD